VKKSIGQNRQESHRFQSQSRRKESPLPLPDVMHMDDIAVLTDEALFERIRSLDLDKDKILEAKADPTPWETEACYLRREFQIRRQRHQQHENYLHGLDREAEEARRQEEKYPVADLDNSYFMFLN
jgi:hypothetical protein